MDWMADLLRKVRPAVRQTEVLNESIVGVCLRPEIPGEEGFDRVTRMMEKRDSKLSFLRGISEGLCALEEEERFLLTEHYVKNRRLPEVAELLELPTAEARARLRKALNRLKKIYGEKTPPS